MKGLLPLIPVAFLFLFNSCDVVPPIGSDGIATAIVQTHIAETRAAAPTQTPNLNIPIMINWLNDDLSSVSPLGRTVDAEYHVVNVSFPDDPDSATLIFRVDVGCICMNRNDCCLPERTFVVILEAMYRSRFSALAQVPGGVSEIMVVCSNHQTKKQIGAITAPWQYVDAYLRGHASGDQLGIRTTQTLAP